MKKVVIVDDSKAVIGMVDLALTDLREAGAIDFAVYQNPLDVVALIEAGNFDFDLMFCDVNMPQMSGYELVQNVKGCAKVASKPILMLTTEAGADSKETAKKLGVTGFIAKPFSEQKIQMAVKKLLAL